MRRTNGPFSRMPAAGPVSAVVLMCGDLDGAVDVEQTIEVFCAWSRA